MKMDGQTIIRIQERDQWLHMDVRPLKDNRLSFKAKGILAYLLGKPDDWTVRIKDIVKQSTDGEHAVRSGLKELKEAGYLKCKQERRQDGTYSPAEYIVLEEPLGGFPHTDNPHTDNQVVTSDDHDTNDDNTNISSKKEQKPDSIAEQNRQSKEDFEKAFGPTPTKEKQSHPDPVGEIEESLENYYARDKETAAVAVTKKYCKIAGINFDTLPEGKRESIIRRFSTIIENWGGASKKEALLAMKEWRDKYHWKTPNAWYDAFENEYGQLLQAVKDGSITDEKRMVIKV